jgi:hypothetical protein
MTIHARAQNALADAHDQLVNGITDGSVTVDDAPKIWQDASAKIVDEHLKTVDKSNVELVRAGLEGNIGSFGRSVNQAIVTKNRQDIGAKLYDYIEQMQRFGMSDPEGAKKQGAMAIDSQGPLAGYNAEQVAKLRQRRRGRPCERADGRARHRARGSRHGARRRAEGDRRRAEAPAR